MYATYQTYCCTAETDKIYVTYKLTRLLKAKIVLTHHGHGTFMIISI